MKDILIYVSIGHYGEFDEYSAITHYVGDDKEKAFNTNDNVCDIGTELKSIHVEVWKNETHIKTYNKDKKLMWDKEIEDNQS